MRLFTRIILYTLSGVAVLAKTGAATVFVVSERTLHHRYDISLVEATPVVPTDSASIAEGRRVATTRGCHGPAMTGEVFFDEPGVARVVAPNLTRTVPTYSDAELVRLLRHGVRRNGESVFAMPSDMFAGLSDADLGRLLAYLRTVSPADGLDYELALGPLGRVGLVLGQFSPIVGRIDHSAGPTRAPVPSDTLALGRYLAHTSCPECHGMDLLGGEDTPPLVIAQAYPDTSLVRLMRTGLPLDGRDMDLMDEVARGRFAHFTDAEFAALHAYLHTLRAPPASRS